MKQVYRNLGVLLISIIVCLLLVEVGFRVVAPQALFDECDRNHPDWPRPMIISDTLLGHTPKASGSWCVYQPDTHEKIMIETNSKGLRGKIEYEYKKPDDTFRVLLFGDSFVWGEELHEHQTIAVQLKKELEKRGVGDKKIEVIPFGVGSYGMQQVYLSYNNTGQQYEADIVMYLFYQNDITEQFKADMRLYPRPIIYTDHNQKLAKRTADEIAKESKQRLGRDHGMYLKDNNKTIKVPPDAFMRSWSHFYVFAKQALKKQKNRDTNKVAEFNRLLYKLNLLEKELANKVYLDDFEYGQYLRHAKILLRMFKQDVESNNASFVMVNIPSVYQSQQKFRKRFVEPLDSWSEERKRNFMNLDKNWFMEATTTEINVTFIDLTSTAMQHQNTFYDTFDNHWNPHGVAMSAKTIARGLREKGLV